MLNNVPSQGTLWTQPRDKCTCRLVTTRWSQLLFCNFWIVSWNVSLDKQWVGKQSPWTWSLKGTPLIFLLLQGTGMPPKRIMAQLMFLKDKLIVQGTRVALKKISAHNVSLNKRLLRCSSKSLPQTSSNQYWMTFLFETYLCVLFLFQKLYKGWLWKTNKQVRFGWR